VTCDENLRERACLAEIRRGATRKSCRQPGHGVRTAVDPPAPLSLVAAIFGQRAPILDVATLGDRVRHGSGVGDALQRSDAGWQPLQSRPIASSRPWPRDVRGRLRLDGASLEALLPGVACHAFLDLVSMTCVDDRQSWPLGIDNSGVDASRNHFTTPEGFAFFGAAALGDDAGARWLVADRFGALALLDATRGHAANAGAGDDVVALARRVRPPRMCSCRRRPPTGVLTRCACSELPSASSFRRHCRSNLQVRLLRCGQRLARRLRRS
jgi:hypothetical protein